jgi:hypothetical protein
MKLGMKELEPRGDAGLTGAFSGEPFGDRPVKPPDGRGMCVGRLWLDVGRDMVVLSADKVELLERFEVVWGLGPDVACRR